MDGFNFLFEVLGLLDCSGCCFSYLSETRTERRLDTM